ncbi:Protein of unknown function [Nitrosomonas aestuarii]|uniref:DUF3617 domain-containing protein n=1 Tax=Nitrosomonas aestuarii TaxID=52441 RepID=A0A1I3Y9N5_9PROT|nr:DUF3617 domain-containing protein [Nitrosomonas aestuarii]SFK28079.1 Protein of unknown function [Nitrosomonas aestuarii]
MFKIFFAVICFISHIIPVSAAQNNIRPGLWEVSTTSDLLALVPHIPSAQMQQITDLAKQYGLVIPKIQNNAAVSQVCITAAMAAQEIPTYFYNDQSGCTVKNATRNGNRFQVDLVCNNAQFQGDGTAEGVFISPEEFTGHTEFDSIVMGNPVHATAETSGRWIGENCSIVQPALPDVSSAP